MSAACDTTRSAGGAGPLGVVAAAAVALALAGAVAGHVAAKPRLGNDSMDYLSLAYNVAAGRGFVTDIRWHFFDPGPVRHSAIGERQPAYPALLALGLKVRATDRAAIAVTAAVACGAAAAVAALTAAFYGLAAGLAAAVVAAACPMFVSHLVLVAPAGLYVTLIALAQLAAAKAEGDRRWAAVAGLLLALVFLTRGEGLAVAAAIVAWLAWRDAKAAAVAAGAAAAALLPFFAIAAAQVPGPAVQSFHLRTKIFAEGMWYGYGRQFPPAAEFLAENWAFVARRVLRNAAVYFAALWRPAWLGLGLAASVAAAAAFRRLPPRASLPMAAAAAHWAAASAMWSTTSGAPEPEHLAGPLVAMLVPLVGWAVAQLARISVLGAAAAVLVMAAAYAPADAAAWQRESYTIREARKYAPAALAVAGRLGPDDTVASCRPWTMWYLLRRPTVILPRGLSRAEQAQYLRRFGVRAIVDAPGEAGPWTGAPGVQVIYRDPRNGYLALVVNPHRAGRGCGGGGIIDTTRKVQAARASPSRSP